MMVVKFRDACTHLVSISLLEQMLAPTSGLVLLVWQHLLDIPTQMFSGIADAGMGSVVPQHAFKMLEDDVLLLGQ